jgi:hypothetical protein
VIWRPAEEAADGRRRDGRHRRQPKQLVGNKLLQRRCLQLPLVPDGTRGVLPGGRLSRQNMAGSALPGGCVAWHATTKHGSSAMPGGCVAWCAAKSTTVPRVAADDPAANGPDACRQNAAGAAGAPRWWRTTNNESRCSSLDATELQQESTAEGQWPRRCLAAPPKQPEGATAGIVAPAHRSTQLNCRQPGRKP